MRISSCGVHRGSLQIATGAVVSAYSGSVIDFTLTGRTASDGYLINDLSRISGTPTYTITVSADQAEGEYKLAQGAANFTGTITIGDGTTQYGSITVNGDALEYKSVKYTLIQNSGNLTLNILHIDTTPPEKPVAAADITAPTNGKVTVTASFSSDSRLCQFSLDQQTWQTYEGGIVFDDNGAVYFRSQDAAGNWSQVEAYEVSNIDKVAPTLEVSGNPTAWTN
jgi:hypothetical protein